MRYPWGVAAESDGLVWKDSTGDLTAVTAAAMVSAPTILPPADRVDTERHGQ